MAEVRNQGKNGSRTDGKSIRRVSDSRSADGKSIRKVSDNRNVSRVPDGKNVRKVSDSKSVSRVPDGKSIRKASDSRSADGKSIRKVSDSRGVSRSTDGKSIRKVSDGKDSSRSAGGSSGRRSGGRSIQEGAGRGRKKKKKGNLLMNLILVVAIAVFCVSAYQLLKIGKGYYDGRSEYDKLKELAITEEDSGGEGDGQTAFQVNFDELKAINPDTVAWIRFAPEPAIISYPVVQGKDNEVYLHKTFSDNENTLGTIFLNVDNNKNFTDENTIIYGHRMNDGSMFRHLEDYKKKEFWEANPNFYIYTPDGRELVYQIFSVGEVLDTSETYLTEFPTNDDYQNFLNMTRQVAMYDTGVEVTTANTIVTLSTCTSANNDHRFVVRGVKISD